MAYRRDLTKYVAFLGEREETPASVGDDLIVSFIASREAQGAAPTSVARNLAAVRMLHRFLVTEGLRSDDPTNRLDGVKVPSGIPKPLDEESVWNDVRERVAEGQQAYVVCPLVEESEKLEVASAEETFERLSNGELADCRLSLLHGRMSSVEKEETMASFRRGEVDVLVATTVIEVGVDVPNATVMVVLDADRFGIAQLHQLRGRVGRGQLESNCWLVTADQTGSNPRVEALVASTDGFELAEVDLELRGEGTLMSTSQKGRSDLRLASLRRDRELVELARSVAFDLVDVERGLDDHPMLADELDLLLSDEDESFLTKS